MYREYDKGTPQLYCDQSIYAPSEEKWQRKMPEWAKGRRTEIMDRIVKEFPETSFIGYSRSVVVKLRK